LATLPLELEVVKEGDDGDISLLTNDELEITREFNKMVDEIVKLTETSTLNFARAGSFHIYRSNIKRRCVKCPEETEQVHEAKVPEQAGAWEDRKAEAEGVVVDLAQVPAVTVFARTVGKECLINQANLVLSKSALNVGLL